MFIYKVVNRINSKVYVGKTIYTLEQRLKQHIRFAKNGKTYLAKDINKYGAENFTIELLEEIKDKSLLNKKEQEWIEKLDTTNPKVGYNLTKGGDGGNTYKYLTESQLLEIKEKISVTHSNKIVSEEVKKKISESRLGEKNPFYGKKRPDQSKKMLGVNNPMYKKPKTEKQKEAYRNRLKKLWEDPEYKEKMSRKGKIPWNKGLKKENTGGLK